MSSNPQTDGLIGHQNAMVINDDNTDGSLLITTRRSSPLSRLGGNDGSSPSGSLIVSSGTDSDTADSFAEQLRRASMYVNMDNNNGRIGDFEVFFLR